MVKQFYLPTCLNCGRKFRVNKIGKMGIESPYGTLEMDIENVVQNNYHAEFEIEGKGKVVIDLKDIEVDLGCPFCKKDSKFALKNLVLTDRLD